MPEMSGPTAPDDASFTLPARPGVLLLEHPRVDLLAGDPTPRRLPEGTAAGLAVLAALVLFSCLVGGLTAGFVVIGVSTLLTASAALVTGHLSLGQVGGQRSANLLLGVGAAALILGSVVSERDRPAPEVAAGTPVPVSTSSAVTAAQARSTYAATTPVPSPSAQVTGGSASPAASTGSAPGLTLSPDALAPRPDEAVVVQAEAPEDSAAQVVDEGVTDAAGAPSAGKGKDTGKPDAAVAKGPAHGPATGTGPARGSQTSKGSVQGAGRTRPATTAAKATKPAKTPNAQAAKPAQAGKPGQAGTTKPAKPAKPAKAKPPVVVRHGVAVVSTAVRDLL